MENINLIWPQSQRWPSELTSTKSFVCTVPAGYLKELQVWQVDPGGKMPIDCNKFSVAGDGLQWLVKPNFGGKGAWRRWSCPARISLYTDFSYFDKFCTSFATVRISLCSSLGKSKRWGPYEFPMSLHNGTSNGMSLSWKQSTQLHQTACGTLLQLCLSWAQIWDAL